MKQQLIGFFLSIVIVFSFMIAFAPTPAAAIGVQDDRLGVEYGEAAGLSTLDVRTLIARIVNVFVGFLGLVFVLLTLYAGWGVMMARGNSDEMQKALGTLKHAIIGLIVILMAYSFTSFILNSLLEASL